MRFAQAFNFRRNAVAAAAVLALSGAVYAQVSTATLKGQITSTGAAAATVTAVNQDTGAAFRTTTQANGAYSLVGLPPGTYVVRVQADGATRNSDAITLHVGETANLDLQAGAAAATSLSTVTVVGTASRQDVRDSQVGTLVSQKMIEALPQTTRNFLSAADLAPGVAFSTDGGGNTKIQAGAQNFDHVNVYIDGVGQKTNILRGGLSGQCHPQHPGKEP